MMSRSNHSKEFFELVKAIGESKSKQEEDQIIVNEIQTLKGRFAEKGNSTAKMKEFLVRLIYIEMLGHDATFAYVYAIQLTASHNLLQKRVGYLCSALCLSPEHEFRFMLVNQIQRDLQSDNILEVSAALVAVCKLVTEEMIPAVLPIIADKLLKHDEASIRKKAAMALHRCYQLSSDSVEHLSTSFRNMLYDKDPAVMGASLCWLYELASRNPAAHKDLVPSYVSVLKQITEHRLAKEYDYHRVPAPWMQIKLLKILAVLGRNDQRVSEEMYEALIECMRRADIGCNVGFAVICECVKTVTAIYPNTKLLDSAAAAISRFITSDMHNLKYLGITGLASIVRDHPRYAAKHQMVVLDCLEDPDETLKRQTLDLLYRMTNPVNAEVIVEKLLGFLRQGADEFLKRDLVSRITQLAERYAPNNSWYVQTMTTLFELGGDLVESQVMHGLLRLIGEGSDDEQGDREMREEACDLYVEFLETKEASALPEVLLCVMFWTLGEYSYLLGEHLMPDIIRSICKATETEISTVARGYAVSAVFKMSSQLGTLDPVTAELVDTFASSISSDMQQRCTEIQILAQNPAVMSAVCPVDASSEDFSDANFEFLRPFVEQQLGDGMPTYNPPNEEEGGSDDDDDEFGKKIETLRYEAYEKPEIPSVMSFDPTSTESGADFQQTSNVSEVQVEGASSSSSGPVGLNLKGVKPVWGAAGYAVSSTPNTTTPTNDTNNGSSAREEVDSGSNFIAELGFELPPGITLKDIQDDLRAREQLEGANTVTQSVTPSSNTNEYDAPAVTTNNSPPLPEKPKELSDREQMAAALFGGVSATSSESSSTATRRARRRIGRRNDSSTEQAPPEQEMDLLGITETNSSPQVNASSATVDVDLLGTGTNDLQAEATIAAQSNTPAADQSMDLLSLLGSVNLGDTNSAASGGSQFFPNAVDTPTFGNMWGTHDKEERKTIAATQSSIEAFAQYLGTKANVAIVEVIPSTQEAIFSGKNGANHTVLIHAKLRGDGNSDLMVRSQDSNLTLDMLKLL